jgi:tripartite ATP-independent transporter DctM subunit
MIFLLFGLFILFALIRVPIAYSLGLTVLCYLLFGLGIPLEMIPHKMVKGLDNYVFLAIPLFLLAGRLMNAGGITHELFSFARILVGHYRGGLAQTNVLSSILFSWMSGSAVATVGALGEVNLKAMKENGFNDKFSASIITASSVLGPIIPPSIPFIIYAAMTETSVGKLFVGGIIPGLLIAVFLSLMIYFVSWKNNYPKDPPPPAWSVFKGLKKAIIPLMMPVIMLGGILAGVFTPTEAAGVAAFYALVIGIFYYRTIKWKDLPDIFVETMVTTAVITFIISTTAPFSYLLTIENAGESITASVISFTQNKWAVLLLINLILLFFGAILEAGVVLILFTPILYPLAIDLGIDPIHFGVIMVVNLMIGVATPPVGVCLFMMSHISKIKVEVLMKAIIPFLIPMFLVLLLVTYFPEISMFLVNHWIK